MHLEGQLQADPRVLQQRLQALLGTQDLLRQGGTGLDATGLDGG
jgi:hypothetical protein